MQIHTHTRLTAPFPGLPGWAGTRKVKPIWTVSGTGISWAICKSAPCSRQITTPAPHHSVFYRPDALPAAQPTASKHWRLNMSHSGCALVWHVQPRVVIFPCPTHYCPSSVKWQQPTAWFMIHVTCRLTAKNWDQLRNPTLGSRVSATFTFFYFRLPPIFWHLYFTR